MAKLIKILILTAVFLVNASFSYASLNHPLNGQELNFIHVLFDWDQEPNAYLYNLQVSISETFDNVILDINEETTMYIEKDTLEWGNTYYWKVRVIYDDNSYGEWSEISYFSIGETISEQLTIEIYDYELMQDGLIIYHLGTQRESVVIDKLGNEVWNSQNFTFRHVDNYGQLYGTVNQGQGAEITFNNQILWETPVVVDDHEIKKIPNGNSMGFISTLELGPIALGDWTEDFQNLGYVADGVTNEFNWAGTKIVEWDRETGEEVWSWDPFEHFTTNDFDLYGGSWWGSLLNWGWFDWTHSNAFFLMNKKV